MAIQHGQQPIVVLGSSDAPLARIVYHALRKEFPQSEVRIILENPISKSESILIWRKRLKRLGIIRVIGQILFNYLIYRCLNKTSKQRNEDIKLYFEMSGLPEDDTVMHVPSVNSDEIRRTLQNLSPA